MPNKTSAKSPCSTVTDPSIVRAVRKAFKADHTFDGQRTHMGVSSRGRVVTLTGFVTSKALKKKAGELVGAIRCVKKVTNDLGDRFSANCGPTQKACCGGCIDRSRTCNCID